MNSEDVTSCPFLKSAKETESRNPDGCPVMHNSAPMPSGCHDKRCTMRAVRVHKREDSGGLTLETNVPVPSPTRNQVGDRVYTHPYDTGAYAEYFVTNETNVHHLHGTLTFSQGAALGGPYYTAYKAMIIDGKAKAGQSILIRNASNEIGLACCQLGRAYGMLMAGAVRTKEGESLTRHHGLHYAIQDNKPDYMHHLMTVNRDVGYDLIISSNGTLEDDIKLIKPCGIIILLDLTGNKIDADVSLLVTKQALLKGSCVTEASDGDIRETEAAVNAGLDQGWIKPVIAMEYPLTEAPEVHFNLAKGNFIGKVIMSV